MQCKKICIPNLTKPKNKQPKRNKTIPYKTKGNKNHSLRLIACPNGYIWELKSQGKEAFYDNGCIAKFSKIQFYKEIRLGQNS